MAHSMLLAFVVPIADVPRPILIAISATLHSSGHSNVKLASTETIYLIKIYESIPSTIFLAGIFLHSSNSTGGVEFEEREKR